MSRGGHSYISTDDLASLDLSPTTSSSSSSASPLLLSESSPFPSPSTTGSHVPHNITTKRVVFCPLALLIHSTAEGERDPALVASDKLGRGRPRLQVRTYSVDTPNLTTATTRAWRSVCAGFSSSLQPLLSPASAHPSVGSTCSITLARPSSPDRERERTSFARSRSYSDPPPAGWGRKSCDLEREKAEEEGFLPHSPPAEGGKLKIKLPGLTRRCCPATSPSSTTSPMAMRCKGILKPASASFDNVAESPVSSLAISSPPRPTTFPALSPHTSLPATLCLSPSRSSVLTSSTSPPSSTTTSTTATEPTQIVPLTPCCPRCSAAAEYGAHSGVEYVERFSKTARRKRRRDSVGAGVGGTAIGSEVVGVKREGAGAAGGDEEEDTSSEEGEGGGKGEGDARAKTKAGTAAPSGEKGLAGAMVDEVQWVRGRRGEKDGLQVYDEQDEADELAPSSSSEEDAVEASTTAIEDHTPLSPPPGDSTQLGAKPLAPSDLLTPPTSPEPSPAPLGPPLASPLLTAVSPSPHDTTSSPAPSATVAAPPPPPPAPKRRFSLSSLSISRPSLSAARMLSSAGKGIVDAGMAASASGGRFGA